MNITLDEASLLRCCGSRAWVRAMLECNPFTSIDGVHAAADSCASDLRDTDWLEAFSAHPEIGDRSVLQERLAATSSSWEGGEQSGVDVSDDALIDQLADGNRQYRDRFGFIFLICATGLTGSQMLAKLQHRLSNEPDEELRIAAAEQQKITHLRIDKLLDHRPS